ncbi:aminopeptidase P family N-terminal domain-containing protein [Tenacibaculum sp. SG-28]|uniref:aminopeptidase P family N-terminal domain-containing protein n=1 Tax=Tenacibaculum sp. SG-28 TaxID=754426 RepID=UPI000CF50C1A|nr:aminopeptidase P family N-terminal domain-containing protein [Tenacibaculum sp. SG-28]
MITQRLQALRDYMASKDLDAIIIPSTDPHQSEYVAPHWKLREYFSGFTGSAGTLVITKEIAALWTDSRYFLQFEDECKNSPVTLYKQSIPHAPEHVAWLCNLLPKRPSLVSTLSSFQNRK